MVVCHVGETWVVQRPSMGRVNLAWTQRRRQCPPGITSCFPSHARHRRSLTMVIRLLLLCLCLGILRAVTGCAVEFPAYGTPASGGETDPEAQPYRKQWEGWDEMYRPWSRPAGYSTE